MSYPSVLLCVFCIFHCMDHYDRVLTVGCSGSVVNNAMNRLRNDQQSVGNDYG